MKRSKIAGIIGTILVHVAMLLFLILYTLSVPKPEEEGGVPVMLGNTELAQGESDPYTLTEVDMMKQPETTEPEPESVADEPILTQKDEPTIRVKEEKPKKKEEPKKEVVKKESKPQPKPKEKTEAEKRAEAERAAAQAASSKIAGAFGKGSKMGSKGEADAGSGFQGSPMGNSATGKTSGIGGTGTFDLNGRSLGTALPKPIYNDGKEEAIVVVDIVVNPKGQVVRASVNLHATKTTDSAKRKAAMDAAKKARFNAVSGVDNQAGTITYYFKRR